MNYITSAPKTAWKMTGITNRSKETGHGFKFRETKIVGQEKVYIQKKNDFRKLQHCYSQHHQQK